MQLGNCLATLKCLLNILNNSQLSGNCLLFMATHLREIEYRVQSNLLTSVMRNEAHCFSISFIRSPESGTIKQT